MYYLCYSSTWCSSVTWKYLTWRRSSWEVRKRYKAPSAGFRGWQVCSRRARSTVTRWSWWRSRGAAFRTRHPRLWCVLLALRASRSTTDDGPTPTSLIGIRLSFDTCTSQIGVLLFCFFRLILYARSVRSTTACMSSATPDHSLDGIPGFISTTQQSDEDEHHAIHSFGYDILPSLHLTLLIHMTLLQYHQ